MGRAFAATDPAMQTQLSRRFNAFVTGDEKSATPKRERRW